MHSYLDPIQIAEDDQLRSNHIRDLVHEATPVITESNGCDIPKVLVQYWDDLQNTPADVRECLDSWEALKNQGFDRVIFDYYRARDFVSRELDGRYLQAFDLCHHPAMRCDYFRLCYILHAGGFYLDADEVYQGADCNEFYCDNRLKVEPLCYEISTGRMIDVDSFMIERKYSPDWIFYVDNTPLIAPANHPIMRLALDRATRILLTRAEERLDIQSTTGPGNLTASLVTHSITSKISGRMRDFMILSNWGATSISRWPLSYRDDERNWRLWDPPRFRREPIVGDRFGLVRM